MSRPEWERCADTFDVLARKLDHLRNEISSDAQQQDSPQRLKKMCWLEDVSWCAGLAEGAAGTLSKIHEED